MALGLTGINPKSGAIWHWDYLVLTQKVRQNGIGINLGLTQKVGQYGIGINLG